MKASLLPIRIFPYIVEILIMIRRRFPRTTIQITSNGALIDKKMAKFLAELGQIEINLALNSSTPLYRRKLMNDKNPERAVQTAETMPREELRKLQLERLQNTVKRVYENVPFYKQKLREKGVEQIDDVIQLLVKNGINLLENEKVYKL